jgi:hypothetical protein
MSAWFEQSARPRWAAAEPYWGIWRIPQSRLPVLPADLAGAVAVEFGCGLVVEDMIEVQVPPGAINDHFPEFPDQWVRRWPAEEVWFARR